MEKCEKNIAEITVEERKKLLELLIGILGFGSRPFILKCPLLSLEIHNVKKELSHTIS